MRIEAFYSFMKERENIRLKKENGLSKPWTDDVILQQYKFTNVNREHDKTTRWMREHWTNPNQNVPLEVQLFNCALFRYFGTIEFAEAIGYQYHWNAYKVDHIQGIAHLRLLARKKVFTGAYVITNQGIKAPKQNVVLEMFLTPFWEACPDLVRIARKTLSWEAVAKEMMKLRGFGGTGFMTKEILQDAMHTAVLRDCVDRNSWCPVGPGARRGLNRVYERPVKASVPEKQMLSEMRGLFSGKSLYWPSHFEPLDLHCIQFQLCEFDKYERVRLGEGKPRSRYNGE